MPDVSFANAKVNAANTNVFGIETMVSVSNTNFFAFVTLVIATNSVIFVIGTMVFVANAGFSEAETILSASDTASSVTEKMVGKNRPQFLRELIKRVSTWLNLFDGSVIYHVDASIALPCKRLYQAKRSEWWENQCQNGILMILRTSGISVRAAQAEASQAPPISGSCYAVWPSF